jgi:hypothetical protein
MAEPTYRPVSLQASPASDATVIDVESHWLAQDGDLYLGFECANPALQIERWGQEAGAGKTGFFA